MYTLFMDFTSSVKINVDQPFAILMNLTVASTEGLAATRAIAL